MIDVDDVRIGFGDVSVLDGVTASIDSGEFVGLVGPNGAGKTTLLRTINGLLSPDDGQVRLGGDSVDQLSAKEIGRRVATVPQDTHVGFSFTAEHLVEMGRTPHRSRLDWSEAGDPVDAAMERTETAHLRDRTVDGLSGGERQRVLLARALAAETPALLLDEPTASLDINHQTRVLEIVSSLVDEDRTALAAIHDLDLAARYCDRLLLLHEGRIPTAGPPEEVLADAALEEAFDTGTAVSQNPATGSATVTAMDRGESNRGRVHVVGGGEHAARIVGTLWRAGYAVTLGVVPEGDVAASTASQLGIETITAPPFSEPAAGSMARLETTVTQADAVVVTDGPGSEYLPGTTDARGPVVDMTSPGREAPDVCAAVENALARERATVDD